MFMKNKGMYNGAAVAIKQPAHLIELPEKKEFHHDEPVPTAD